uniref:Uncharacterized protein n=1 Tax=uncultured prokaryote TaxID=198431 RepID=A0A0H5QMU5_9ZZZZ|nr:hypothetical protein [uncultured prokaryote]
MALLWQKKIRPLLLKYQDKEEPPRYRGGSFACFVLRCAIFLLRCAIYQLPKQYRGTELRVSPCIVWGLAAEVGGLPCSGRRVVECGRVQVRPRPPPCGLSPRPVGGAAKWLEPTLDGQFR